MARPWEEVRKEAEAAGLVRPRAEGEEPSIVIDQAEVDYAHVRQVRAADGFRQLFIRLVPAGTGVPANSFPIGVDDAGYVDVDDEGKIMGVVVSWFESQEPENFTELDVDSLLAEPPPGSVIRCSCGCSNVHVRAQDGLWVHAESIEKGDPERDTGWYLEDAEEQELLHRGREMPPVIQPDPRG